MPGVVSNAPMPSGKASERAAASPRLSETVTSGGNSTGPVRHAKSRLRRGLRAVPRWGGEIGNVVRRGAPVRSTDRRAATVPTDSSDARSAREEGGRSARWLRCGATSLTGRPLHTEQRRPDAGRPHRAQQGDGPSVVMTRQVQPPVVVTNFVATSSGGRPGWPAPGISPLGRHAHLDRAERSTVLQYLSREAEVPQRSQVSRSEAEILRWRPIRGVNRRRA